MAVEDHAQKDKAMSSLSAMSSAQIISMGAIQHQLAGKTSYQVSIPLSPFLRQRVSNQYAIYMSLGPDHKEPKRKDLIGSVRVLRKTSSDVSRGSSR